MEHDKQRSRVTQSGFPAIGALSARSSAGQRQTENVPKLVAVACGRGLRCAVTVRHGNWRMLGGDDRGDYSAWTPPATSCGRWLRARLSNGMRVLIVLLIKAELFTSIKVHLVTVTQNIRTMHTETTGLCVSAGDAVPVMDPLQSFLLCHRVSAVWLTNVGLYEVEPPVSSL
jgi:hypothetical protein